MILIEKKMYLKVILILFMFIKVVIILQLKIYLNYYLIVY